MMNNMTYFIHTFTNSLFIYLFIFCEIEVVLIHYSIFIILYIDAISLLCLVVKKIFEFIFLDIIILIFLNESLYNLSFA